MFNQAVITDAGRTVLAAAAAGSTLIFDNGASGAGTVDESALAALTDVSTRKESLTIVKTSSAAAGVTVEIMLTAAETAYQAKQIGIFGHTGNGSAVLLAVFQDTDGIAIPAVSQMADFAFVFIATLQVANVSAVQVTVDPSALVTQSQLTSAVSTAVQQMSTKETTVTLDKDDWTEADGYYTQTVSVSGMTAAAKASAAPTAASWLAAQEANVFPPVQGQGTLSFKCEYEPSEDIQVVVHIYS